MPKRTWNGVTVEPWGDLAPPLKTRTPRHIRALHDKTLTLLYEGANRKNNNYAIEPIRKDVTVMADIHISDNKSIKMKQMCIAQNGSLCFNKIVEVSERKFCRVCKHQIFEESMECSYCETLQCQSCAIICSLCYMATCANCSVSSYGDYNQPLCLSCCK